MASGQVLDMSRHLFRTSVPVFLILTSLLTFGALTPVSNSNSNPLTGATAPDSTTQSQNDDQIWQFLLENFSSSKSFVTGRELDSFIKKFQQCNIESNNLSDDTSSIKQNSKELAPLIGEAFCDGKVCNKSVVVGEDVASSSKSGGNNPINGEETDEVKLSSFSCSRPPPWRLAHENYNDVESVNKICHQLLFHIANPECCRSPAVSSTLLSRDDNDEEDKLLSAKENEEESVLKKKEKPSSGEVWGYGLLFVTIISLCSLAGVSVMPFMEKDFYKNLLTVMVGLAVGSLTGSAVFHLLPQAFGMSEHDPHHDYLFISLVVCGGIWMFFMVERILNFIMDFKQRKDRRGRRSKMSSILSSTPENSTISMLVDNASAKGVLREIDDGTNTTICSQSDMGVIYECQDQAIKATFDEQNNPRLSGCHEHQVKFEQGKDSVIATVAWMIIFGDGLHNFIDGLSIGAAFNQNILTGMSISVAVLCEELPHELGDFAVLLNAGMSIRQALTYNFFSALTCYLGLAVGIFLGEIEASIYIFAVAGGMFLYIALVDMVPEMNEIAKETSKISVRKGMKVLFLQNLGLITGISTLFLLAKYQDSIHF